MASFLGVPAEGLGDEDDADMCCRYPSKVCVLWGWKGGIYLRNR